MSKAAPVHLIKSASDGKVITYCGLHGAEFMTRNVFADNKGDCFVAVLTTDPLQGGNLRGLQSSYQPYQNES